MSMVRTMDKNTTLLQEAISVIRAGQRAKGRALLRELLREQPENVTAWSLLSIIAQTESEQKECLASVLALDPENTYARRAVRKLQSGESLMPPPPEPSDHVSPAFEVMNSLREKVVASIVLNGYNIKGHGFLGRAGDMHSFKVLNGELRKQWRDQEILSFRDDQGKTTYVRVAALPVEKDGFGLLEIL